MRDQRVYLLHAIDAVDAILSYTDEGRELPELRPRLERLCQRLNGATTGS